MNHIMTQGNQHAFSNDGQSSNPHFHDETNDKFVVVNERWYYPPDIANDLKDVDLSFRAKEEVFATAWEYARCVIPEYTNWSRYVAFMRTIIIGIIAEFRGNLMDVVNDDRILGYSLTEVLEALCGKTVGQYVSTSKPSRPSRISLADFFSLSVPRCAANFAVSY